MEEMRLGVVEARFADLVWENEPIATRELVSLCATALGWKRTTTYTVLKKLCERGILAVEESVVRSLVSREKFYAIRSERFVEETFDGSLPAFIAAFTSQKRLSPKELEEIRRMIDAYGKE